MGPVAPRQLQLPQGLERLVHELLMHCSCITPAACITQSTHVHAGWGSAMCQHSCMHALRARALPHMHPT